MLSLRAWLLKKLAGNSTVIINAKITGYVHGPNKGDIWLNSHFIAPPGDRQTRYDVHKVPNSNSTYNFRNRR
jgi:hypothetical protein